MFRLLYLICFHGTEFWEAGYCQSIEDLTNCPTFQQPRNGTPKQHWDSPERKAALLYGGHQHVQGWNFWCQQCSPCGTHLWSPDKALRGHKLTVLTLVNMVQQQLVFSWLWYLGKGGTELGSQFRGYRSSGQGNMVARVALSRGRSL